jgi:hypothetical protein
VPNDTQTARLHELAKRGAEVRLRELLTEASDLVKTFPPLKDAFDADELPAKFLIRRGADKAALKAEAAEFSRRRKRGRRRWTAAQREEAAKRMKAYWAKRKHE